MGDGYILGIWGVSAIALDEKSFTTSMIREPKVRFFPGKELRVAKSRTSFEKVSLDKKDEGEGGGEGDRPEIE